MVKGTNKKLKGVFPYDNFPQQEKCDNNYVCGDQIFLDTYPLYGKEKKS